MRERWFTLTKDGWQDVITGLLRDGQLELALKTLDDLPGENIVVEPWLKDLVIYVLCEEGEIEEAFRLLKRRVEASEPNMSHHLWYHMLEIGSAAYNVRLAEPRIRQPLMHVTV